MDMTFISVCEHMDRFYIYVIYDFIYYRSASSYY
jgi:hypothetical protein